MIEQLYLHLEENWIGNHTLQDLGLSFNHNKLKLYINSFGLFAQFSSINFLFSEFYIIYRKYKEFKQLQKKKTIRNKFKHYSAHYYLYKFKTYILVFIQHYMPVIIILAYIYILFYYMKASLISNNIKK